MKTAFHCLFLCVLLYSLYGIFAAFFLLTVAAVSPGAHVVSASVVIMLATAICGSASLLIGAAFWGERQSYRGAATNAN
jgi:hypothetical protein